MLTPPVPRGADPGEHRSSPCSPAGVSSRMVSTQQAQRRGLLPHGLQHHHALSPAQGTVLGSLPSFPTLSPSSSQQGTGAKPQECPKSGLPCLTLGDTGYNRGTHQEPRGPRTGKTASGWERWRRPRQEGAFDLGLSLLCQGVRWERCSGRRT